MTDDYEPHPDYPPPKGGEPPLHAAARLGDHAAIRALVADGADVNGVFDIQLDPQGPDTPATPLMVAAGSGDGASIETVELLLALGAEPRTVLMDRSAARFAARGLGFSYRDGGDALRLRRLLELGCDPDETWRGIPLLSHAATRQDAERVRVLLAAGANPDPPGLRRRSRGSPEAGSPGAAEPAAAPALAWYHIPLFEAALAGSTEMTGLLLDAGADVHVTDHAGSNVLFYCGSKDTVLTLAAAGADLEHRNEHEWTPLIAAAQDGDVQRAAGLIAAGANIHATHHSGFTVFMSAVGSMERSTEMMQFLIDAGADPHAVTDSGWNAFHAALDVNGYNANTEESVRSAFAFLHRLDVDINHRDHQGVTPLIRASTPTETRLLREFGAQ
jgi:ankyrin repeat protein